MKKSSKACRLASALAACAVIALAGAVARGQQLLTAEWIASEAGAGYADTPRTAWRSDGLLWIYDARDAVRAQALEVLNPTSGVRRPVGDPPKVVAALNATLPESAALKTLPWPDTLDAAGQQGLYVLDGDLFLVRTSGNFLGNFPSHVGHSLLGKSGRIFFTCLDIAEDSSDRIRLLHLRIDPGDCAGTRSSYAHHRLICLDLDDLLVSRDLFARLHFDGHDCCFRNRFAQLGHNDGDLRHSYSLRS